MMKTLGKSPWGPAGGGMKGQDARPPAQLLPVLSFLVFQ
jgi:hypothetical protein